MKRFKFSLEKVLELRRHREKEKKALLAAANGEVAKLEGEIKEFHGLRRNTLSHRSQGDFDLLNWQAADQYYNGLGSRIKQNENSLVDKYQKREQALDVYSKASRDLKVFEKIKDKKLEEYRDYQRKEEQKVLDDMVGSHYRKTEENTSQSEDIITMSKESN